MNTFKGNTSAFNLIVCQNIFFLTAKKGIKIENSVFIAELIFH